MDIDGHMTDLAETTRHAVLFSRALLNAGGEDSELSQLTIVQLRLLFAIELNDQLKMQDLAERLQLKIPTMSHLVERLVKRGLLSKNPDPLDRRIVRLALTKHAVALMRERTVYREAYLRSVLDALPTERRENVYRCLQDVSSAVSTLLGCSERKRDRDWADQVSSQEIAPCP
jgi:DNA-binding MarR family transcriptional regulator